MEGETIYFCHAKPLISTQTNKNLYVFFALITVESLCFLPLLYNKLLHKINFQPGNTSKSQQEAC